MWQLFTTNKWILISHLNTRHLASPYQFVSLIPTKFGQVYNVHKKNPNPSNLNVKWTRLIMARESSRIPWRCVSILNWFKNRRGNFIWGYRQGFYVFHFHVNVLGHILSLKPSFFFREYKLIRYVKFWLKLSSVNRLEHWTVLFRLTAFLAYFRLSNKIC